MLTNAQQEIADLIFLKVERLTNVPKEKFISGIREIELVNIRTAIAVVLSDSGWNLTDIGRVLVRDHSTIIHLKRRYQNLLFQHGYSKEHNQAIELAQILFGFMNELPSSLREEKDRTVKMHHLASNGASMYSIVGVAV